LRLEAQRNHFIGLIEYDMMALVEYYESALKAVKQPVGGGDDNLTASPQDQRLILN